MKDNSARDKKAAVPTAKSVRAVMGARLKEFRELNGKSAYAVARDGDIRIDQVNAVETGETNYTIDSFLGYIRGCGLYIFFSTKNQSGASPHDLDDLAAKGIAENPRHTK